MHWSKDVNRKRRAWDRLSAPPPARSARRSCGRKVDERQRGVLDRSYRYAYGILAASAGAGLSLVLVAPALIPSYIWIALFLTAVVTLPTAVLAWTEPDPPEDG